MTYRPQLVFLHSFGSISLVVGLILLLTGLWILRRASSAELVQRWEGLCRSGSALIFAGLGALLTSGTLLMLYIWKFAFPWLNLSVLTTLFLLPLPFLIASKLQVIRETAREASPSASALQRATGDQGLWSAVASLLVASLALWAVMALKPPLVPSALGLTAGVLLGVALGRALARPPR